MRSQDSQRILVEVTQRIMQQYGSEQASVENALFDTIYFERRRLEKESDSAKARREERFYDDIQKRALRASYEEQRALLREMVERFSEEVLGHFSPAIYQVASKAVPPALNLLLNSVSPSRLVHSFEGKQNLSDQLVISGDIAGIQAAAKRGTVVMVPTHLSNLDSILIGFAIDALGLPPFTYGAGYNLFSNKLIGFFMRNLGAYKVDRKKSAPVYKDVLKTYAGCSMEMGYHNLFFPGGTRCRSGLIEPKLKLGLLGMTLDAYIHNLRANKKKPDIFVVPCTLNYQLVLEAETLITDYLKEKGQNRYIIEDDEFSKPKRILEFATKLLTLDSKIHFVVGKPMDVFGNIVGPDGVSLDRRGRSIDRTRYVQGKNGFYFDAARDHEYTRELACEVSKAFHRNTVLNSTNVVSYAVFRLLKSHNPQMDLFRLLRTGGKKQSFSMQEVYFAIERVVRYLTGLEERGILRLDPTIQRADPVAILSEALAHLSSYHIETPITRRGDRLFHGERSLLYYYQNRVDSFKMHGEVNL